MSKDILLQKSMKLLKEIEWIFDGYTWTDEKIYRCPSCRNYKDKGHLSTCKLNALLRPDP